MNNGVAEALGRAERARGPYAGQPPERKAACLRRIAEELVALGTAFIDQAAAETALSRERLIGERARTTSQLEMFARLVEEGSWVDARIDTALPSRQPAPKPDMRRMLVPIGPVVVFGASNFPVAFSVAGGDTASALAAGCPVVVRPHPAHPATGAMAAQAVERALAATGMPGGVVSIVGGESYEVGLALVRHPLTRAVAFTGSLRGGRALWDAAAARPEPIPVYAEMGSLNPVFLLKWALDQAPERLAESFAASMTLGVGQFCTKPGLLIAVRGDGLECFLRRLCAIVSEVGPGTMLSPALCAGYADAVARVRNRPGVDVLAAAARPADSGRRQGGALVLRTTARDFIADAAVREEMFGPASLVVVAENHAELEEVARHLPGQLTATVHASEDELAESAALVERLGRQAGRLIFNGFPTGLEVCPSTHHGGPYPATTDPRSTSVGTAAILRFARPLCYQGFPEAALPPELQDANPRHIWRTINGQLSKDPVRLPPG